MAKSMVHWNGCICAAMDVETTGLDPKFHEITEIAILPLDSNLQMREDVMPFNILIKPEHPDRYDADAQRTTGLTKEALSLGHDKFKAADLLYEWVDGLGLPMNRSGYNRCKILPLGHNYASFDYQFIKNWLGAEMYDELFHHQIRDTMIAINYINDFAAFQSEPTPYPKLTLKAVATKLGIRHDNGHRALEDCRVTAEVYRALSIRGMIF